MSCLEYGQVWTVGSNDFGQLGIGSKISQSNPQLVQLPLPKGVTASRIACGGDHSMVLASDGTVLAWGWGEHGQIGVNSTADQLLPVFVQLPSNFSVAAIFAGGYGHSGLLSTSGQVAIFGECDKGQCGRILSNKKNNPEFFFFFFKPQLSPSP